MYLSTHVVSHGLARASGNVPTNDITRTLTSQIILPAHNSSGIMLTPSLQPNQDVPRIAAEFDDQKQSAQILVHHAARRLSPWLPEHKRCRLIPDLDYAITSSMAF